MELLKMFAPYQVIVLLVMIIAWVVQYNRMRWTQGQQQREIDGIGKSFNIFKKEYFEHREEYQNRLSKIDTESAVITQRLVNIEKKLDDLKKLLEVKE